MASLVIEAIGGLSLLILGMTMMSSGLKMSAGKRIKKILNAVSSNRVIGCLVGVGITTVIQSSSATTIILIGFVSAGLLSMQQAIGMILGANIGTSMTAQLIAFQLSNAAMPAIIVGVAMKFFTRKKQVRYWGEVITGFGLIFLGITIMRDGLSPMKADPAFINFFTTFSPNTTIGLLLSVLLGAIFTIVIQSSSATIGLTMALASQGLITFPGAMALVLGENIGTTITAELSTIGLSNVDAIRTARAHTMFNAIGVAIVILIFPIFINMVDFITVFLGAGPVDAISANGDCINVARYIANGHTIFNTLNAILFLFILKWLVKFATLMSPEREREVYRIPNFADKMLDVPMALIAEVRSEILQMAEAARCTFVETTRQIEKKNYKALSQWRRIETHLDDMQRVITSCLVRLYQNNLNESESGEISSLMRMTNNIERIGDSVESIARAVETLIDEKMELSLAALNNLNRLSDTVLEFIDLAIEGIRLGDSKDFIVRANILEDTVDTMREEMRQEHIERIKSRSCGLDQGLVYINILTNLEKIGDYCFNIAHAVTERK